MEMIEFSTVLFFGSFLAGLIGATSGLGGGIILMPLMTLYFKVNILYAIGASLMGVIATSLSASTQFLKKDLVDVQTTAMLETATVPGAIGGAYLATVVHEGIILIIFGFVLLFSIIQARLAPAREVINNPIHRFAGWLIMLIAGIFSGLLGIGSGAFKVLAMDRVMRMPFKVSTATSSFMIGVTACASASTFYLMGYISHLIVMSLVPGVILGSYIGAKLVSHMKINKLRLVFTAVIFVLSLQLIIDGTLRMMG